MAWSGYLTLARPSLSSHPFQIVLVVRSPSTVSIASLKQTLESKPTTGLRAGYFPTGDDSGGSVNTVSGIDLQLQQVIKKIFTIVNLTIDYDFVTF